MDEFKKIDQLSVNKLRNSLSDIILCVESDIRKSFYKTGVLFLIAWVVACFYRGWITASLMVGPFLIHSSWNIAKSFYSTYKILRKKKKLISDN